MEYWSQIWETLETIPNKKDSTKESCDSYTCSFIMLQVTFRYCISLNIIFILFCFKLLNHILISHVLSFGNMSWETNQRRFMLVTVTCPEPASQHMISSSQRCYHDTSQRGEYGQNGQRILYCKGLYCHCLAMLCRFIIALDLVFSINWSSM